MSNQNWQNRRQVIQATIPSHQIWLISDPADISYLTGFNALTQHDREAFLALGQTVQELWHSSFSPLPTSTENLVTKHHVSPTYLPKHTAAILTKHAQLTQICLDAASLTLQESNSVKDGVAQLEKKGQLTVELFDPTPIRHARAVKESTEIELLKQAGQVAAKAWRLFQPMLKPGITELEASRLLNRLLLENGADKPAFPTIVAFGEHTALPHHQPTHKPLPPETAVLIDFGAQVAGYHSDLTRSWWFGKQPSKLFTNLEKTVMKAYAKSIAFIEESSKDTKKKLTAGQVDQTARRVIADAGWAPYFIHTTGHGLGLEIHEHPSLHSQNETVLESGMAITIEPGIYLTNQPDTIGFRYENTILLTSTGVEVLTTDLGR